MFHPPTDMPPLLLCHPPSACHPHCCANPPLICHPPPHWHATAPPALCMAAAKYRGLWDQISGLYFQTFSCVRGPENNLASWRPFEVLRPVRAKKQRSGLESKVTCWGALYTLHCTFQAGNSTEPWGDLWSIYLELVFTVWIAWHRHRTFLGVVQWHGHRIGLFIFLLQNTCLQGSKGRTRSE